MNKNIFYTSLLLLLTCFIGCSDSDKDGVDVNSLVLESSIDELHLDRTKADETAVTFTWNKGTDRGADYTLSYFFRLDAQGGDFTNSTEPIEISEDGERSVNFTHRELSQLLGSKWNTDPGSRVTLQGRIVAKVTGPKFIYPEISYTNVMVENYKPEPLFIMGSATIAGDDPTKAVKINEAEVGAVYHWQGLLQEGGFKFISTLGEVLPSLNMGANKETIVNRTQESEKDNLFPVDKEAIYSIILLRNEMKIVYTPMPYTTIFLIGNATSAGWEIKDAIELVHNPLESNSFSATVDLKGGEFKFYSAKNWDSTFFKPLKGEASISTDVDVIAEIGGDDRKWKVQDGEEGKYKITLNTVNLKLKVEKVD